MSPDVRLVPVDEPVLERLVEVAVADAAPDDVTPPLTEGVAWSLERIAWLRAHHREARADLGSGAGTATWAVVVDGDVAGAVRLHRPSDEDVFETGIWLAWSARGRGIGVAALQAVLDTAVEIVADRATVASTGPGEVVVRAVTDVGNLAAQALLRRVGFVLSPPVDGVVHATWIPQPGRA